MSQAASKVIAVEGLGITDRMEAMGVVGMVETKDGWVATFARYPGAGFLLPHPVAEWLLAEAEIAA
jgi:hypothetical protein